MFDDFADGKKKVFQVGDTLFKQDDKSQGVYIILKGKVDLWRKENDGSTKIATITSGDLLGEVSVFEGNAHSVTAVASLPTTIVFIGASAFKKSFSDPLVRFVVNTLSARLRSNYAGSSSSEITQEVDLTSDHLTIEGNCQVLTKILSDVIELKNFPFQVGNKGLGDTSVTINLKTMLLPLHQYSAFQHNHFDIIKSGGGILIRDKGSQVGTIVNGKLVRKYDQLAVSPLKPGENSVKIPLNNGNSLDFKITVPWSMMPS